MRVLVCGGRSYINIDHVFTVLSDLHEERGITTLIHGCAPGADSIAANWARTYGVKEARYPAEWNKHGKAAGPIRNANMLLEGKPELVVAFPGENGTAHMVQIATNAGVEVIKA